MKSPAFNTYIAIIFLLFATQSSFITAAPDDPEPGIQNTQSSVNQDKQGDIPDKRLSLAERILKIEANIVTDKQRIKDLQKELDIKRKNFSNMSVRLRKLSQQKQEKEKQFSELADPQTEAALELQNDLDNLSEEYELVKKQADLSLKMQKTLQAQISSLKLKIENDKNLLEGLRGNTRSGTISQQQELQNSTSKTPADTMSPIRKPLPFPSTAVDSTVKPPDETTEPSEAEPLATPEQIEAQKEEQEKRAEAKIAEQIVVDYVERKQSLEHQIRREQELLNNEVASRSNIETYLKTLEQKQISARQQGDEKQENLLQEEIKKIRYELNKIQKEIVSRSMLVNQLHQQLNEVQEGQIQAVKLAEEKRQAAEKARQKNVWLQSPLHPHNIAEWAMTRGPRVLMVVGFMVMLLVISRASVNRLAKVISIKGRGTVEGRTNRAETIALSMAAVIRLVIYVGGTLLVLEEAGVDIRTILGGAAILGLAFAFGAQNLMRDYFSGIMILLEDQYELGDVVTVGGVTGVVERVNMRATVLRDLEGKVHFIPNGEIKQVTNRTYEWSQAVFDISVSYRENVDKIMELLMDLARQLQQDPQYKEDILSDPVMLGVNEFGDAAVTIKFVIKTRGDKMWPVKRELLRRIKNKFDETGIQIPIPQREVKQIAPV